MPDPSPDHSLLVNESLRQRFEASWMAGTPEPLSECLPGTDTDEFGPTLEELIHIQLEFAWKAHSDGDGERPVSVQALLEEFPVLGDDAVLLRLLRQEYHCRETDGDSPSADDYRSAFPDMDLEHLTTPPGETIGPKASDDTAAQGTSADQATLLPPGEVTHSPIFDDVTQAAPVPVSSPADEQTLAPPVDDEQPSPVQDDATLAGGIPGVAIDVDNSSDTFNTGTSDSQAAMVLGKQVPGYELLGELGRGGMGVVYRALDTRLKRVVALKMILSGAHADEGDLKRFQREAESVAQLQHPNIVQIHDVGEHDGQPFISLEFVEGGGLDEKIGGEPQPPSEAVALVEQLARAVHFAHERNIVHRDLKPANVLLTAEGEAKITDFGLAKRLEEDASQTASGSIMGTPSYMAPEQAGDKQATIGPQTDVYALGAIFYCLLTGRPPFQSSSVMDTVMQVLEQEPVPPRQLVSGLDKNLETITLKCLQKSPERRYQSAEEVAEELRRYQAGEPIQARPVSVVERSWRWARRNPLGTVVLALMVGLGIAGPLVALSMSRQANVLRKEIYRSDMQLASQAWRDANMSALHTLVERHQDEVSPEDFEWHYWKARSDGMALQFKPSVDLAFLVFDPKDSRLVGLPEKQLKGTRNADEGPAVYDGLWALEAGESGYTIQRHDDPIGNLGSKFLRRTAFEYSDDGDRVALAFQMDHPQPKDRKYFIKIWDRSLKGGPLNIMSAHTDLITSLAFSPDKRQLLSSSRDGTLKIWSTISGDELVALAAEKGPVRAGIFSPDGKWIISTSGPEARIWNAASYKVIHVLGGHARGAGAVAVNAANTRIACSCGDGSIRLWDLDDGRLIRTLVGHGLYANHVIFSPNDRLLVSAGYDSVIRIWDVRTGDALRLLKGQQGPVSALAVSPDGLLIASSSRGDSLRLWALNQRDAREILQGHRAGVSSVAFSPDGKQLASASLDQTVRLWTVETGAPRITMQRPAGHLNAVAFSPDGKRLATVGWNEKYLSTVVVFDCDTGQELVSRRVNMWCEPVVGFSRSGVKLSVETSSGIITPWSERPHKKSDSPHPAVRDVLVGRYMSADGTRILTNDWNDYPVPRTAKLETVKSIWKSLTASSRERTHLRNAEGEVVDDVPLAKGLDVLALGAKGRWIAGIMRTGQQNNMGQVQEEVAREILLIDSTSGETTFRLSGHKGNVNCAAFSADGSRLATGGVGTIKLWDVATGKELLTLRGHTGAVQCLNFSPDGQRLASGGVDAMVRIWDATRLSAEQRRSQAHMTELAMAVLQNADTRAATSKKVRSVGLLSRVDRRVVIERTNSLWADVLKSWASTAVTAFYRTRFTKQAVLKAIKSDETWREHFLPSLTTILENDKAFAAELRAEMLRMGAQSQGNAEFLFTHAEATVRRHDATKADVEQALALVARASELAPDAGYWATIAKVADEVVNSPTATKADYERVLMVATRATEPSANPAYPQSLAEKARSLLSRSRTRPRSAQERTASPLVTNHPFLGIGIAFSDGGVSIGSLLKGGPADLANLKVGQLIVQLGPYKVGDHEDLFIALGKYKIGQTVPITVEVAGQKKVLQVTLSQRGQGRTLGEIQKENARLSKQSELLKEQEEEISRYEQLVKDHPESKQYATRLIRVLQEHGETLRGADALAAAANVFSRAIEVGKKMVSQQPDVASHANELAGSYQSLGSVQNALNVPNAAVEMFGKAIAIREGHLREFAGNMRYLSAMANSYKGLAGSYDKLEQHSAAIEAYRKAIAIEERIVGGDGRQEYVAALAQSYSALGNQLQTGSVSASIEAAIEAFRKSVVVHERLVREYPKVTDYKYGLTVAYHGLGTQQGRHGQVDDAIGTFNKAIGSVGRLVNAHPRKPLYRKTFASLHRSLGPLVAARGGHTRVAQMGETLARVKAPGNQWSARALNVFVSATLFSLAAKAAASDKGLDEEGRRQLVEKYATRSVQLLRIAHAAGYFSTQEKIAEPKIHPSFRPLSKRADFKAFLRELEAKPAKPKKSMSFVPVSSHLAV